VRAFLGSFLGHHPLQQLGGRAVLPALLVEIRKLREQREVELPGVEVYGRPEGLRLSGAARRRAASSKASASTHSAESGHRASRSSPRRR
jgi:hypothetical protein